MLSREVHTSLRGRGMATVIRPFSFREFLRHRSEEPKKPPPEWRAAERSLIEKRFREFLVEGTFPETQGLVTPLRIELLQGYVDNVLFRDVVVRYGVSQVAALAGVAVPAQSGGKLQRAPVAPRSEGAGARHREGCGACPPRSSAGCLPAQCRVSRDGVRAAAQLEPPAALPGRSGADQGIRREQLLQRGTRTGNCRAERVGAAARRGRLREDTGRAGGRFPGARSGCSCRPDCHRDTGRPVMPPVAERPLDGRQGRRRAATAAPA
jgi:hypothetical protein